MSYPPMRSTNAARAANSALTAPLPWWATGSASTPRAKKGYVTAVHERKNFFIRPAVANIDALVFIAANTNPVTDPFLIDRVSVITEEAGCELIVCINKADIDPADELYGIYSSSGFETHRVSAKSGAGIAGAKSRAQRQDLRIHRRTPASASRAYSMPCSRDSVFRSERSAKSSVEEDTQRGMLSCLTQAMRHILPTLRALLRLRSK